jgi:uncharacterized protein (DUF58 family)
MKEFIHMSHRQTRYAPSKQFFMLLMGLIVLAFGCFFMEWLGYLWLGIFIGLIAVTAWELVVLKCYQAQLIYSSWSHQPIAREPFQLTLNLECHRCSELETIEAILSDEWITSVEPVQQEMLAPNRLQVSWKITPQQRGQKTWPGAYVHWLGRFKLIQERLKSPCILGYYKIVSPF